MTFVRGAEAASRPGSQPSRGCISVHFCLVLCRRGKGGPGGGKWGSLSCPHPICLQGQHLVRAAAEPSGPRCPGFPLSCTFLFTRSALTKTLWLDSADRSASRRSGPWGTAASWWAGSWWSEVRPGRTWGRACWRCPPSSAAVGPPCASSMTWPCFCTPSSMAWGQR